MSQEQITALGIVITFLTLIVNSIFSYLREKRRDEREERYRNWDKEDREARNKHLADKIDENTRVSVQAFDAANHTNEKIATIHSDVLEELRRRANTEVAD